MLLKNILPVALAVNLAAAWDVTQREQCTREGNFCLTSFIWCNNDACNWPENSVPLTDRPYPFAYAGLELASRDPYRITWQGADPAYPLQIEFGLVRPEWSINITTTEEGYYEFQFYDLLIDIVDTQNPGLNDTERYVAQRDLFYMSQNPSNHFWISQPERPVPDDVSQAQPYWQDRSSRFSIMAQGTASAVRLNRQLLEQDLNHKWSLGVGIGVGVGVPLLLVLAFMLGQWRGKKVTTRKFTPASDDKVPVHSKRKIFSYPVR